MSTEQTRTDEELARDPQAFDAKLAALYAGWQKATDTRDRIRDAIHEAAGDRREYKGRVRVWRRTLAEVEQTVKMMAAAGEPLPLSMGYHRTAAGLLETQQDAEAGLAQAALAVQKMEAIYAKAPWPRFFPCDNRDGHIHSSLNGCPTVRWTTAMSWRPDLSGKTIDEAVADLGPALCSVCFPGAPVEQKSMTLGQVKDERTRAEREAAAAVRQAAKDAKRLAADETAEIGRVDGWWIETVAAALDALRKEVEFRDYFGHGVHPSHGSYAKAAPVITRILLARETAHPGWGADQAKIDRTIANAVKKNIRDGARLDPATGRSLA